VNGNSESSVMIGFGIEADADARFLKELLTEAHALADVTVVPMGGSLSVWAEGRGLSAERIQQLNAYAQGVLDTLAKAAGRKLNAPEPRDVPEPKGGFDVL
jgi:hypothetical protein